jgi:hypothetical protein
LTLDIAFPVGLRRHFRQRCVDATSSIPSHFKMFSDTGLCFVALSRFWTRIHHSDLGSVSRTKKREETQKRRRCHGLMFPDVKAPRRGPKAQSQNGRHGVVARPIIPR